MTIIKITRRSLGGMALAMLCVANAQAQLSHNLSIGNPVSLAMANSAVAYIEGPDAIHFNPAALALIENEYKQYRLQLSFIDHQGSISGQGNGQSFDVFDNPDFQQDPLLQGQRSREVETTSLSLFLPFFDHVKLPFLIAPGYGFAMRSENGKVVFANSALAIQAFGYQRDKDNVAAFNGQQFGITRISYFNPSFGFELEENWYLGFSIGFAWQGLGITSRTRSALNTIAQIDQLLDSLPGVNDILELNLNPYNDVGTLTLAVEDPLSTTYTIGTLWHPTPWLSLGMTYQSEGKARMEGDFNIVYNEGFNNLMNKLKPASGLLRLFDGGQIEGAERQSGKVKGEYTQPQWAAVGMSVMATERLRVNMDVKWVDYSVLKELRFVFDRNLDYLVLSSVVNNLSQSRVGGDFADPTELRLQRRYEAVVDWSLGVEYSYNDRLKLRAGYEPRSSAIPEERQDLLIPIGEADLYTTGFGYTLPENTRFDFALGYLVSKFDIPPGQSRNANSMIEGDVVYNPYRGLHIKHKLSVLIMAMTYSKRF